MKKGFSLIELLVVVSIIAILATIGFSIFSPAKKKADDAKRQADILAIAKAFEIQYARDKKYSPLTGAEFANGKIPAPPEGGSYYQPVTSGGKGFRTCASLAGNPEPTCSEPSEKCFCKDSTQGVFIASAVPTPTPGGSPAITPPPATKKFSCNFNTFENLPGFNGTDPNLVYLPPPDDAWLMFYTIPSGFTTNIHLGFLPNSSLGAPVSQWVPNAFPGGPLSPFIPGAWDNGITETASFATDGTNSRIYYVAHDDPSGSGRLNKPLKIGFMYDDAGIWKRRSTPVLSGEKWWEKNSPPSGGEFGEPSVVFDGSQWHMYYQTCSNQTAANGYPSITEGCFIGHRISADGITWGEEPIGFGGHPWMYTSYTDPIGPIPITGFTKPEVKLTPAGSIQWVGGNDIDSVRYGEALVLDSALIHEELLFTVNDCKTKGSWCNWRIDAGHTFGVEPDGSIWVYFTSTECLLGARPADDDSCNSIKWNINRIHCDKN